MSDLDAVQLALRARAVTAVIATTGAIAMSVTAAGYVRAAASGTVSAVAGAATFSTSQAGKLANGGKITVAGTVYTVSAFNGTTSCTLSDAPTFSATAFTVSFATDGFYVGQELLAAGCTKAANNGYAIVSAVDDLLLSIAGGRTAEVSAAGKTLSVSLPALRGWENEADFAPVDGRPFIDENFVPAPPKLMTFPANQGHAQDEGLYVLNWYFLAGYGSSGIRKSVGALLALFTPGTAFAAGSDTVRVPAGNGAYAGQILRHDTGRMRVTVTIPWLMRSTNVVAA